MALAIPFLLALTTLIGAHRLHRHSGGAGMSALAVTVVGSPAVTSCGAPSCRRQLLGALRRLARQIDASGKICWSGQSGAAPFQSGPRPVCHSKRISSVWRLLVLCALLLAGVRASRSELDHSVPFQPVCCAAGRTRLGNPHDTSAAGAVLRFPRPCKVAAICTCRRWALRLCLQAALAFGPARRSAVGGVAFLLLLGLYKSVCCAMNAPCGDRRQRSGCGA